MILKPGYWRFDYFDDDIFECYNNKASCFNGTCLLGYIGPLCETCDSFGEMGANTYYKLDSYKCSICKSLNSQWI
jgi:hypothetical protein